MKKLLVYLFTLSLLLLPLQSVKADSTYHINVYPGNQGTISDTSGFDVDFNSDVTISTETDENGSINTITFAYTYNGVEQSKTITVSVEDSDKYYARGLKEAGKDNDTSIQSYNLTAVSQDIDYVISYGVKGEVTTYTIQYLDADGNELLPSVTRYAMVGEQPIVAAVYIDGYVPNAANATKTLVKDPGENIIPFRYTAVTPGTTTIIVTGGTTTTTTGTTTTGGGTTTPTTPVNPNTPAETGNTENPNEPIVVEIPNIINIDDPSVPLAPGTEDNSILPYVATGAGFVAVALALILFFLKKNKKEEEEEA